MIVFQECFLLLQTAHFFQQAVPGNQLVSGPEHLMCCVNMCFSSVAILVYKFIVV